MSCLVSSAIRKMRPQDLPDVLAIEKRSSVTPWSERMFLDEFSNPFAFCYVIEEGGAVKRLVAYICFRILGNESEVLNLCVSPSWRGQGFGRKLMEFYLESCLAQGVERSYLEVCSSNDRAMGLYRSLSYEVVGRRKRFYQGRFDAFTLMKTLRKTRIATSKEDDPI